MLGVSGQILLVGDSKYEFGRKERTEIDTNIDVACVGPDLVPDVVGKDVRSAASFCRCNARKNAVHVDERSASGSSVVVTLPHVDSHRVDGGDTND